MRCGLRDGGAATCRNTRGLDHRVATGIALAREGAFDAEHAERFADPRVVELAATFGMEESAADVFLETVTQPFLGFLTAFYRAHPAKRPFDARMVVPVDVIVYQDEHLITGTFLPMLGIDGFRLHTPEESLRGAVRRMTLLRFCKLASTVGLACFVGLVIDPITTDHAIRPSIPRRSMTPVPELRLDSLVPVPDHVVVGHVDEPVQRDAREAAFAEELLLEPVLAPHPQRTPAGVAELPDRVRSAAFVCDVQAHGPVVLLPAALRHKGSSSRSGSPRKRHHLEASTSI